MLMGYERDVHQDSEELRTHRQDLRLSQQIVDLCDVKLLTEDAESKS